MTRVVAIGRRLLVPAIAAVAVTALIQISGRSETPHGSVAVIFDNAKGLVPGQAVKVAGDSVGSIDAVNLERTPRGGYKARLTLSVERRFLPFRADARCRILPQGLLSENYVECFPGSTTAPPLLRGRRDLPTVPVERTTVPASLQDLLNTFSASTSQRLRILINELGIGTAGRGTDMNAILRRANPALVQANRVLSIVASHRRRLRDAVAQTDRVLGDMAARDRDLRDFVDNAATVAETAAAHRDALEQGIRRFPPLLRALDASLPAAREIAREGAPLLRNLRAAAPQVDRFNRAIAAFETPSQPALRALAAATKTGRKALRPAGPVVDDVRRLAGAARPFARHLDRLVVNSRERGALEGFLGFIYAWTTVASSYDGTGHFLSFLVSAFPRCVMANLQPGSQLEPGCSHAFRAPGKGRIPPSEVPSPESSDGARPLTSRSVGTLLDYLFG